MVWGCACDPVRCGVFVCWAASCRCSFAGCFATYSSSLSPALLAVLLESRLLRVGRGKCYGVRSYLVG